MFTKKQFYLLLSTVFIGFFGISLPYTIFGPIFLQPQNFNFLPDSFSESERILWLGVTLAIYPLGLFMGSPVLGRISDRFGRKRVIVLSLAVASFGSLATGLALTTPSLTLLLISRVITGIAEGNIAIARAMAQDFAKAGVISIHAALGRVNAAASIAYVLGPIIGGFFSSPEIYHTFCPSTPFYFAALITFSAAIICSLILQETKAAQTNRFSLKELNFLGNISRIYKIDKVRRVLLCSTVFTLAVDLFYEFFPVFFAHKLLYSPLLIAILNGFLSFSLAMGNGWLTVALSKRFTNRQVIIAGSLLFSLWLTLLCLEDSFTNLCILLVLCGLSLSSATVNYTVEISNKADAEIQGEAFGVLMSLRTLGDAVICLLGTAFMLKASHMPLLIASCVAFVSALYFTKRSEVAITS